MYGLTKHYMVRISLVYGLPFSLREPKYTRKKKKLREIFYLTSDQTVKRYESYINKQYKNDGTPLVVSTLLFGGVIL